MGGEPREPWSKVILALAYLGVGGLDEAHDTVQEANYARAAAPLWCHHISKRAQRLTATWVVLHTRSPREAHDAQIALRLIFTPTSRALTLLPQHMTHVQEANYVHALLHRREGERVGELRLRGWSNSSYWWDQTGRHPLFESLQKKAEETSQDLPAVRERLWGVQPPSAAAWDPDKMVMLMAAIKSGAPPELCTAPVAAWCVGMQHFEWESLLLHCHEAATASAASS
ncbi:hypothetical protein JKP88DRAFT_292024 [Tribonema minus]|uniref:Uncharacterized protein n=1 Tax=Tribonema minus TaxID=303371 RepID=A0A836CNP2_9STRA|nr:hypothetical protein JKP88DRAFT_292024 [Tribonema minus]